MSYLLPPVAGFSRFACVICSLWSPGYVASLVFFAPFGRRKDLRFSWVTYYKNLAGGCAWSGWSGLQVSAGQRLCCLENSRFAIATQSPTHPMPSLPRFASVACPPLRLLKGTASFFCYVILAGCSLASLRPPALLSRKKEICKSIWSLRSPGNLMKKLDK